MNANSSPWGQEITPTGSIHSWPQQHANTIWTRYVTMMLGVWLLVTVGTFGFGSRMAWNDNICGILLIIFSFLSLSHQRRWAPWIVCLIGIWLQLAPLILWAPSAAAYLNDTIVGILAITLSILIPGSPGQVEDTGPEIPSGWSYNPSSWPQRLPIILLACLGWFCARYMAAYQLGYIDRMWDPIFGNGTLNVITSDISNAFPISDAGLGAVAYTLEALMGCKGSTRRWRTMPWIVTLFGILVVPLGFVSIILIMLQPLAVGSWCAWCLLTAVAMLMMIALTLDEVFATIQFLIQARAEGKPFWQTFWKGDFIANSQYDKRSPPLSIPSSHFFPAAVWGVTLPWNLILTSLLGIWLLFYVGNHRTTDNLNHIAGALVTTISIVTMAEVARTGRLINILFGIIVITTPFMTHPPRLLFWNGIIVGIALIVLSIPKGTIKERYGTWNQRIF